MKKPKETQAQGKKTSRKKVLIVSGLLAVALVMLLFIFRGWFRMTIIPRTVKLVYGSSVKKVYDSETKKLENPIALLGYKSVESKKEVCETSLASGFSTHVECGYTVHASGRIDQASLSKDDLNRNAKKLHNLLKQNGWQQGGYTQDGTYMTVDKLVSDITAGIDYQPDASYEKKIGDVQCYFSSNTAFSAPNPPTIATQISCFRAVNILGTPSY